MINKHFEIVFNAAAATQIVLQDLLKVIQQPLAEIGGCDFFALPFKIESLTRMFHKLTRALTFLLINKKDFAQSGV